MCIYVNMEVETLFIRGSGESVDTSFPSSMRRLWRSKQKNIYYIVERENSYR